MADIIFSVPGRPTILLIGKRLTYLNGEEVTDQADLLVVPKRIREKCFGRPRKRTWIEILSPRPREVYPWVTIREMGFLSGICGFRGLSYFRVRSAAKRSGLKISKVNGASRIERRHLPLFKELARRTSAPRISPDKQEAIVTLLSEGFSIRETARLVGVSLKTVWRYRRMQFGEHPRLPSMRRLRAIFKRVEVIDEKTKRRRANQIKRVKEETPS